MEEPEIIVDILNYMSLEEALEELDITPEEVIEVLYRGGYIKCPDWVTERAIKY